VKIVYVVNEARFFISHRLPLGQAAQARGYEVVVVTAPNTGEQQLQALGFRHIPAPLTRSGFILSQEIAAYRTLRRIYHLEQPDLVHHVTIKPVIYGSFAARRAGVPGVINAVPGMGFVFTRRGLRAVMLRGVVNALYRLAFAGLAMRIIFQNSEDLRAFINHGIVRRDQTVLIRGSGVDLQQFKPRQEPPAPMVFVLIARMLRDKGVVEYAQAAKLVKARHPDWRFLLVGGCDEGNPSTLSEAQLKALETDYGVEWQGHRDDIAALLQQSHVVVLPTYREGLPKTLLEAAAAGAPMIASDIAGCREVVTDGVTGLLVPARCVAPLADAMLAMGEDEALRRRCGRAARDKAEAVFSVDDVVEHTFRVYDELHAS
jgi:glycosyltransferase involved in cell wall biosynthesis